MKKYKFIPGYPRFAIEYTNYVVADIINNTSDYNDVIIDIALNQIDKYYTMLKYGYVSISDYMRAITTAVEHAENMYYGSFNI